MYLFVNVYNRTETVKKSIESLQNSNLPENLTTVIIDDGSYEPDIFTYYKSLETSSKILIKLFPHQGLPDGKVSHYWEFLKDYPEPYFFISDSDMIYAKNWIQTLQKIYDKLTSQEKRPALITGFDTHNNTHAPTATYDFYSVKETVGGANLLVNTEFYKKYRFGSPRFQGTRKIWEWDWSMSDNAVNNGWIIASPLKSIVQHIGHSGRWSQEDNYDKASNFIGEQEDSLITLSLC